MSRKKGRIISFPLDTDPLWYKDAIIYELHVRAFQDSNGDGIGDFPGLVEKLDYLQDLGVTALWLLPFYPSPLKDDGYDIADYTDVNPIYGTLADFQRFLHEAHRRGLRVITELVVNHTSDQHPWFQRARRAPPGSPERDFYVWSDTPDKYKEARIIFKDFEPSNWTWDPVARAYYWHRFYSHQPDLNFDNPEVHKAIFKVLDFWLDMGIDGLRLDAIPYLYEREGTNCENLPETHAFLKKLRRHVDERFKNRMLLAEANQWPEEAVAYFGAGDECHMAFHFPVMPRLFMAMRMEDRLPIIDILQQTPPVPPACQWAIFLRNHDELTLEMVTDEDRDYMYRVYAQDPQMRINLGIRRRLAPLLESDRERIELLNGLLFSLPGTPVLYYGDEIGMGENIYLGDRNGVRTPMQWSAERNGGFSKANPQRMYFPLVIDPEYHYEAVNVEVQQKNPHSLLWWMKHMIALRKRFRAFGRGSVEFLYPENHKVLAFVRRYQEETILVAANLSRFVQYAELDLSAYKGMVPVEVLGRNPFPPIGDLPYLLTLGPYDFYWFALQPQATAAPAAPLPGEELPALEVAGEWENVFQGEAREALEEALAGYLQRCSWMNGKGRHVDAVGLEEVIHLGHTGGRTVLLLVQVKFAEGDRETYLVPLGFATGQEAEQVQGRQPPSAVCRLRLRAKGPGKNGAPEGVLFDALEERNFMEALLQAIARRRRFKGSAGEVVAQPGKAFEQLRGPAGPPQQMVLLRGAQETDTAAAFDDRLFLKVYRRVEEGTNPELEVCRFLTERTNFTHLPPLAGAVEYYSGRRAPRTLAILQGYVVNEGDAWHHTLDQLGRFFEHALTLRTPAEQLPLPSRSLEVLAQEEIPAPVQEIIGPYLPDARLLGVRTAELHRALASDPTDPAFAPEPFSTLYQRSMYQSIRTQVRQTFELLRKRLKALPEAERAGAQEVLAREEDLLRRLRSIYERRINAQRIRTHGHYHLGQVLYTGKDFVILDWQGDPNRPVSDRVRKRTALRDVAGMLRSFHYATLSAMQKGKIRPEDVRSLEPWGRLWHLWVSVAFLKAYLEVALQDTFLPKSYEELGVLLYYSLLKRAINELREELTSHTDRVRIPLQGLMRLTQAQEAEKPVGSKP